MKEVLDMRKMWKILGIGLILLALITTVSAHWWWNETYTDLDIEQAAHEAEELLKNAELEEYYSYRFDTLCYRIVSEGRNVGILWKDIDIDELTIGEPHLTMWGAKVPLLYNGEIVGQLFLENTENTDWHHGYHGCWHYNAGQSGKFWGHMGSHMGGWR